MKLVIGSMAPDFEAVGNDGTSVHLSTAVNENNAAILVLLRSFS